MQLRNKTHESFIAKRQINGVYCRKRIVQHYGDGLKKRLVLLTVLTTLWTSAVLADVPFRLMTYNGLNLDATTAQARFGHFTTILQAINPDIVLMQEVITASGADVVLDALNSAGVQYARAPFIDGYDTDNMLFYRASKVTLLSTDTIRTNLRCFGVYVVSIGGRTLRLYSCHLKASEGYEADRLAEVTILRNRLGLLPAGTEFIIAGDMNFYTSSEPGYQKFIASETNNNGRAQDLIAQVGNWHNNGTYAPVHTQSTRVRDLGDYGATGGLDDRFDFILSSYGLNNNANIEYVAGTYTPFGNDGNHFNDSINQMPNTAVPANVANALHYASDHLPVYADFISKTATDIAHGDLSQNGFRLEQNHPNPFNPTTVIAYQVPAPTTVTLVIYNLLGQKVRTLVQETVPAGLNRAWWDARNDAGNPVAGGIYLYRIEAGEFVQTRKMILRK